MPALKLLLRRTIATAAVNPASVLPPPPPPPTCRRHLSFTGRNTTLAKGGSVGLGVSVAHVKSPTTKNIPRLRLMMGGNTNTNTNTNTNSRKRLYMLSPSAATSSSSSSPSSSSGFEVRENNIEERETHLSSSSSSLPSSSSGGRHCLVADMGHENLTNHATDHNGAVSPEKNPPHQSSKFLTLPTVLTLARVAAIPVFISTFYVNNWWGTAATTSIFIAAAITDWLDGYLARKMGLGTAFGAFLDPVADKLMVAATLVLLCSRPPETAIFGDAPWLFPVPAIAIIGREITMSAVREWAASQNTKLLQAVAVNNLGKWKTATQMTALTLILATRDSSLEGPGALITSGVVLLYISSGLAVWSLAVYMRKIWKVLMK